MSAAAAYEHSDTPRLRELLEEVAERDSQLAFEDDCLYLDGKIRRDVVAWIDGNGKLRDCGLTEYIGDLLATQRRRMRLVVGPLFSSALDENEFPKPKEGEAFPKRTMYRGLTMAEAATKFYLAWLRK